jgi:hypothetical protein
LRRFPLPLGRLSCRPGTKPGADSPDQPSHLAERLSVRGGLYARPGASRETRFLCRIRSRPSRLRIVLGNH